MNRYAGLVRTEDALMPEMVADLPWPSWYYLFSEIESNDFNSLIVISFDLARDPRGELSRRRAEEIRLRLLGASAGVRGT